jgi:uncharacterized membrane protein (UPF0182 family)
MIQLPIPPRFRRPRLGLPKTRQGVFWRFVILVVAAIALNALASLIAEGLWFAEEIHSFQVFRTRLVTQGSLGILVFALSTVWLLGNLTLAQRYGHTQAITAEPSSPYPGRLRFTVLLPSALGLSALVGIMMLYHGRIAIDYWEPSFSIESSLDNIFVPIPVKFHPDSVVQLIQSLKAEWWLILGGLGLLAIAILIYTPILLGAIATLLSLSFALVISENWSKVLAGFSPTAFGQTEPLFEQDIGFYVFRLPLLELLDFWLVGLMAMSVVSITLMYLVSGKSLSEGRFPGFSREQQVHLCVLLGTWMLAIAYTYWLERYELLYSAQGVTYGASYTNVVAQLPLYTLLSVGALILGGWYLGQAVLRRHQPPLRQVKKPRWQWSKEEETQKTSRHLLFKLRLVVVPLGVYWLLAAGIGFTVPLVVQRLIVQPNELELERPYLSHTIRLTREAFDLEAIDVEPFTPQDTLTAEDIQSNRLTIDNIRLWDTRPLLETNRQLQQFRLYYKFADADVDRYVLKSDDGVDRNQQVLIAAREMDYSAVPQEAQTWINEHLIYTHGYGFTISPVNKVGSGGLPDYLIKDISHTPSNDSVRNAIPVASPRIYYGELTKTYVMVRSKQQELDYPSGSDNVYNTYDGQGGVSIGSFWRRLVFAKHLNDWRMVLTENFTPDTRLLFRRELSKRVRAIAPFLRYDNDPYLVIANIEQQQPAENDGISRSPNYLYWIIDAYTTSDRYPYSDPLTNDFNYIRNSVKVVINAYDGDVHFYVTEPDDPIIQTWQRVFPGMFQALDAMPTALKPHLRYPQDLYQVQSEQLMTYHMTDPQVFYNREDQWRAPSEIYGAEAQVIEPYYLIIKLPTEQSEEFILLRPFTPVQRNNLIAWLAARSDGIGSPDPAMNHYGTMLLYRFPKQELVYGPEQIEARINQDPLISEQISLWNRQGSSAVQGNLLVIPIDQSLLYVEPLYLEASQNQLPTLVRVIVVYENRIVMADNLEEALQAIFEPEAQSPTIIRSVDEPALTPVDGLSPDASLPE